MPAVACGANTASKGPRVGRKQSEPNRTLGAWDPQSDGLIAACLNFRSHPVIEELEARIGKPVVTSTQVALRRLLRLARLDTLIDGFGRLMREF